MSVRLYAVRIDVVQLGVVQIVSHGMVVRLQWFNRVSCKLRAKVVSDCIL